MSSPPYNLIIGETSLRDILLYIIKNLQTNDNLQQMINKHIGADSIIKIQYQECILKALNMIQ